MFVNASNDNEKILFRFSGKHEKKLNPQYFARNCEVYYSQADNQYFAIPSSKKSARSMALPKKGAIPIFEKVEEIKRLWVPEGMRQLVFPIVIENGRQFYFATVIENTAAA